MCLHFNNFDSCSGCKLFGCFTVVLVYFELDCLMCCNLWIKSHAVQKFALIKIILKRKGRTKPYHWMLILEWVRYWIELHDAISGRRNCLLRTLDLHLVYKFKIRKSTFYIQQYQPSIMGSSIGIAMRSTLNYVDKVS